MIFQDDRLSAIYIAERINISSRALEKQLARLKEAGVIERVGSAKTGRWRITLNE